VGDEEQHPIVRRRPSEDEEALSAPTRASQRSPASQSSIGGDAARRLLDGFLERLTPRTLRAYRADLADLANFLAPRRQPTLLPGFQVFDKDASTEAALAVLLRMQPGAANDLALRWRNDMRRRGRAPSTINRRLSAARSVVRCARTLGLVHWELTVPGVACLVLRDTAGPGPEAAAAMLATTDADAAQSANAGKLGKIGETGERRRLRDRAILSLLTFLGLRRNEVCSLDVGDVDVPGRRVWVLRKGHEQRQVLSLADAAGPLAAWLAARGTIAGTDALFVGLDRSGRSRRLSGSAVYQIVRAAGAAAGAPTARPHGLRHTAITQAVEAATEAGLSLDEVRQFSGHKHIATLLRYRDQTRDVQGQLAAAVARRVQRAGRRRKGKVPDEQA